MRDNDQTLYSDFLKAICKSNLSLVKLYLNQCVFEVLLIKGSAIIRNDYNIFRTTHSNFYYFDENFSPLHLAAFIGDKDILNNLLSYLHVTKNLPKCYENILHYAVLGNQIETVKLLIKNPLTQHTVHYKDELNNTALHLAYGSGRYNIAKLLEENGADVNITDNDGCIPITKKCGFYGNFSLGMITTACLLNLASGIDQTFPLAVIGCGILSKYLLENNCNSPTLSKLSALTSCSIIYYTEYFKFNFLSTFSALMGVGTFTYETLREYGNSKMIPSIEFKIK